MIEEELRDEATDLINEAWKQAELFVRMRGYGSALGNDVLDHPFAGRHRPNAAPVADAGTRRKRKPPPDVEAALEVIDLCGFMANAEALRGAIGIRAVLRLFMRLGRDMHETAVLSSLAGHEIKFGRGEYASFGAGDLLTRRTLARLRTAIEKGKGARTRGRRDQVKRQVGPFDERVSSLFDRLSRRTDPKKLVSTIAREIELEGKTSSAPGESLLRRVRKSLQRSGRITRGGQSLGKDAT